MKPIFAIQQNQPFNSKVLQKIEKLNIPLNNEKKENEKIYVIKLKKANADEVKTTLQDLFPDVLIGANVGINSINVKTTFSIYRSILSFVNSIDRPKTTEKAQIEKINIYNFNLKNSQPKEIKQNLLNIYPNLLVAIDERTRTITFKAEQKSAEEILKLIKKLDSSVPQIKIEVQIIEITNTNYDQFKSLFSDLTDGFSINYDFKTNQLNGSMDFNGTILYLLNSGAANILAKPSISVLDNQKASVRVGDQVPYVTGVIKEMQKLNEIKYLDTGIELDILPQITSSNIICADITATFTNVKIWKEVGDFIYPIVSTRKTQSKVNIGNKKTLIISGLYNEEIRTNEKKVPILGDLFLIGDLFKGKIEEKIKTDIVFLITPEIL